jgi:hypothetical protein
MVRAFFCPHRYIAADADGNVVAGREPGRRVVDWRSVAAANGSDG